MSTPLLVIVTVIYALVAIDLGRHGEWMGLAFAGYALANIGIIASLSR